MIDEINQLPLCLRQPMDEELAWELLWNDPLRCAQTLPLYELKRHFEESPGGTCHPLAQVQAASGFVGS